MMNAVRLSILILMGCLLLHYAASSNLQNENLPMRSPLSSSEPLQQNAGMLQVGEELEYSVHYSFFNIGKIHFKVTGKEERNGRTIFHACAIMDSNPSLSWLVELHIRFYTVMDQDAYTYDWLSEDSSSKITTYRKMHFNYDAHTLYYEWGEKNLKGEYKKIADRMVPITGNCQDGLSLFYYARQHALEQRQSKIPIFVDTNEVAANINFGIDHTSEEVDAVKYPIDVKKLDGRANFVGVFGLTGGFEGVFSNDGAGIPITARLKVILGSVKVELMNWKRDNWIPPKAEEEK